MQEIALKESDISKLKRYPLPGIWNSESIIYYYKKEYDTDSLLIKKLLQTDTRSVNKKIETIDKLKNSELSEYKELVLPEETIVVGGIKSGFTIPEVVDVITLGDYLKKLHVSNREKIDVLKKVGELVKKIQCQKQKFYFCDLHEFNFLLGKNNEISVIDLDSSSVSKTRLILGTYIIMDSKTHHIPKYRVKNYAQSYPSRNADNYCYNTVVLNFLAGTRLHELSYDEFFDYINYLHNVGIIPEEMKEVYVNHYTDKKNELVVDYLDEIPDKLERGRYCVYEALQKTKKK